MTNLKRVTVDFETRSTAELKKTGAYKYSLDLTTMPTCLAFKTRGKEETHLLRFNEINQPWSNHSAAFRDVWAHFILDGFLFVAHNAFFETCIYKNILVKRYGWPDIPFRQFRCTAAKAAACALPRSLEGAGSALNLTTQKDKMGYIAMMATCKPTKQWNAWNKHRKGLQPSLFLEPSANPNIWNALYHYCKIDVKTEELLDIELPDLTPIEQEIWFLNQKLNWRGIRVDVPTVKKIVSLIAAEDKSKLKELDSLTMGLVTKPGARRAILEFLELEGIKLPDIRAGTVDDILKTGLVSGDAKRLLEIRKALSKTSTRKYQSFLDRANDDHRVRDILLYHGASTGRDTGTGVQLHNLPKPLISQLDIEYIITQLEHHFNDDITEWVRALYDNPAIVFSSLIRSMLIPSQGCELFVADFSKIEVVVLWWLADNWPGLKVLKSGGDPYKYQAAANTGKRYEDIADDGPDRQLAKIMVLACGYGMGVDRFQETAWSFYRLKLSTEQAKAAVFMYRDKNKAVPALWKAYEAAAVSAIEAGSVVRTGKCIFKMDGSFLKVTLPSGRELSYLKPRIIWRETDYGPRKTIEHMGVALDKKTMRYERTWGGTLTENITQAVARDLMMYGRLRLEKNGYKTLLDVHDESICERKIGDKSIEDFTRILCQRPGWGDENLTITAKGWHGPRYRK